MLGLLLLYFIGKAFYNLAGVHQKNQWTFAILGIIAYYTCLIIGSFSIGLFYALVLDGDIDTVSDVTIGFLSIPFGILGCWLFYRYLKNSWEALPERTLDSNLLDDELIANDGF